MSNPYITIGAIWICISSVVVILSRSRMLALAILMAIAIIISVADLLTEARGNYEPTELRIYRWARGGA